MSIYISVFIRKGDDMRIIINLKNNYRRNPYRKAAKYEFFQNKKTDMCQGCIVILCKVKNN